MVGCSRKRGLSSYFLGQVDDDEKAKRSSLIIVIKVVVRAGLEDGMRVAGDDDDAIHACPVALYLLAMAI